MLDIMDSFNQNMIKAPLRAQTACKIMVLLAVLGIVFGIVGLFGTVIGQGIMGIFAGIVLLAVTYFVLDGNKIAYIIAVVVAVLWVISGLLGFFNGEVELNLNLVVTVVFFVLAVVLAYSLLQREVRDYCGL